MLRPRQGGIHAWRCGLNRRQPTTGTVNTANLQLEGLIMAVSAMNRLLTEKGLVSHADIGREDPEP